MGIIEAELGGALTPAVKRKGNNTRKLRSSAKRVAGGSTEVMVKVTGFGKGAGHVKAHLDYITRNGKVEMENDQGQVFNGRDEVKTFFKDWEKEFGESKAHKNRRDTMHVVLSMPEKIDAESVRNAVREFSKHTFGKNHEYVFALHTDAPHPHCHLTVKCRGFDGKMLQVGRGDPQIWRETFADKLRDQGIDAEATPRHSRGVVKKAESSIVRHIDRGDKTHKKERVSRVRATKIKEAAEAIGAEQKGELPAIQHPFELAAIEKQKRTRRAWLAAADALEQEDTRKTFNNKEAHNEQPDYDRINPDRARAVHRAAALHKSALKSLGRQAPPETIARLRNVSRGRMVHHERSSEMLLRKNAPDNMGRTRATDTEMRRARNGDYRARGGDGIIKGYQGTAAENKALAARIRGFVAAMPGVDETERKQIKADLLRMHTVQPILESNQGAVRGEAAQKKSAEVAAPKGGKKDIER